MSQTYHLEAVGFGADGRAAPILQRQTLRSDSFDSIRAKAVRLLQRSRTPNWTAGKVEAVRVMDGSGAELFRWSIWDDLSGAKPG